VSGRGGITFSAANALDSNNITVATTGSAHMVSNGGGTITLNASTVGNGAGNVLALNATAANITVGGILSGFDIDLQTTSAAGRNITISSDVNAGGTASF